MIMIIITIRTNSSTTDMTFGSFKDDKLVSFHENELSLLARWKGLSVNEKSHQSALNDP